MRMVFLMVSTTICHSQSTSTIFLIKPNDSTPCMSMLPYSECLTLQQFTNDFASMIGNDTAGISLYLLPGVHYLYSDIHIAYTNSVAMRAVVEDSSTTIQCESPASFTFRSVSFLLIDHIIFIKCGEQGGLGYIGSLSEFAIIMTSVRAIRLFNVKLLNSSRSAITAVYSASFIVSGTTISGNNGSGLHISETDAILEGDNFLLNNNGGALKLINSSLYLLGHTKFEGNIATNGGAIWSDNSTIIANGTTAFINNTAVNDGGAIYSHSGGSLLINGESQFRENKALSMTSEHDVWQMHGGGAIFAHNISELAVKGNSSFYFNVAGFSGGGIFAFQVFSMILEGTIDFESNTAISSKGGAISAGGTTLYLKGNVTFSNNKAEYEGGGAINFEGANSILTLNGILQFTYNTAYTYGGAILLLSAKRANIHTINVTFTGNQALNGGAFFAQFVTELSMFGQMSFKGNSASQTTGIGGAIGMMYVSTIEMNGSYTLQNNGACYGGAVYTMLTTIHMRGRFALVNNSAYSCGGALYALHSQLAFSADIRFQNNSAKYGGALYLTKASYSFLFPGVRMQLVYNKAFQKGGGMFVDDSGHKSICLSRSKSNVTSRTGRPTCPFQYKKYSIKTSTLILLITQQNMEEVLYMVEYLITVLILQHCHP